MSIRYVCAWDSATGMAVAACGIAVNKDWPERDVRCCAFTNLAESRALAPLAVSSLMAASLEPSPSRPISAQFHRNAGNPKQCLDSSSHRNDAGGVGRLNPPSYGDLYFVGMTALSLSSCRPKVAACLRTKDYGRFLPEWLAFHYAIGVDEVSLYDDDSSDGTFQTLQPFIEAGLVRYEYHMIKG